MNIGILGLGTVGGGVVNVLAKNNAEIKRRTGASIQVTHAAVRDVNQARICPTDHIKLTEDPLTIVNDASIDVVLELMGGTGLAKELVEAALRNGKHVITANKALIATHGNALLALAKSNNVHLLFEAAVAGGIPILKSLEQGLSANQVEMVAGIINGTGNFILTEMRDKGRDFADVLKEAQELGYAEADPTFDVEGIDAAHKLAILASIAFGCELDFDKVSSEGISEVSGEDVAFATELGYSIKHLGIAKKINGQIQMRVHPTLIPKTQLLANVDGVMNAVLVKGNAVGPTLYYGAGAGAEATASAVIADLVDVIKGTVSADVFGWKSLKAVQSQNVNDIESVFYLRLLAKDTTGVLADITSILANHNISVESVVQKQIDAQNNAHIAIITNSVETGDINTAVAEIQEKDFIQAAIKIIHVETLD
ncbi:homoserine dehydrogenase [Bathymodiolus septemdierum thioautotrophic gill symbiont]|uniref:Homoserine dehydrogenase n=1 Tax=endosymbiont of Bathymodiolus septemdierum str. Myojin knoll TaxID=1303921 RepID=A0A0P0US80_9GAMM|nr:homoserine dehydrogenase [Bathymodiolus septemdierum thioautotrophic gill symbiont]BAS68115.1 homoserine dehydrogenase [endosymbiont of Bathymodiolus septemdierum str. Myojin knoll]